jgi:serine/threonine-protein kinase
VVERELGRGGMSTVYLAQDTKHQRPVAIKVLRPELAEILGPTRFLREIRIAARLIHPNILPLHESGDAGGLLYYVMPYVSGESLRQRLQRGGALPIDDVLRITREIAEALAYAHAQGIVHRDIKPENILLEAGHAVVADFGIARAITAAAGEEATSARFALGTPAYMSPEQTAADPSLDGRSDIYSLGCVLFEMLAGEPPYTGGSPQSIAAKHLMQPVPQLRIVRPGVPGWLQPVIDRAIAKIPGDRYQSAAEFGAALQPGMTTGRPPPRSATRRIALALALLVLAGGAVAIGRDWAGGPEPAPASAGSQLDPTHLAVLYFDHEGADSTTRSVANGLTEDLIDRLGQVPALSVLSAGAVRPFRDHAPPLDSIGRALGVGTIVTGTLAAFTNRPRVTVRLIDAATGRQIESRLIELPAGDVLTMRAAVSEEVARFLRQRLGREIELREIRAGAPDAAAWMRVRRVADLREDARRLFSAGDSTAALKGLDLGDSLLAVAERRYRGWATPTVLRGWIADDRIDLAEGTTDAAVARWARVGLRHAERALLQRPGDVEILELRGRLRMMQWYYFSSLYPALVDSAEKDLRAAAVPENPSQARAWSALSFLLLAKGSLEEAHLAAQRAYETDAFLADAPTVIFRLYHTSLLIGQWSDAARWCREGGSRFPADWLFTFCRLTLRWMPSGQRPDGDTAWKLVSELERVTAPTERAILLPRWRMMVAGILARAGLPDSARRVLAAAKGLAGADPEMDYYEAAAHMLLGERGEAISLLRRYVAFDPAMRPYIARNPMFEPLRGDSAFMALLQHHR